MKMVEDTFRNHCFIIDVILSGNDSTMRDVLKYPSKDIQCKAIKSPKQKLDEETPLITLLAYPSHLMKVFAKQIFSIVSYGKAQ